MKSINLIVHQWNGLLGYGLDNTVPNQPIDLLADLLSAGLEMFITRYVSPKVKRQKSNILSTNTITYYRNPNAPNTHLYLTVEKPKRLPVTYEIRILFQL